MPLACDLCTKTLGYFVVILLAISLFLLHVANSRFRPFIVRSIDFEDLRHGKLLKDSVLETFWGLRSVTSCALACGTHPKCRSFTFCKSLKCALNREDMFSGDHMELLIDDGNCLYGGMLRESVPACYNGRDFKDIQDDIDPGACEINQKRIDAGMGDWLDMPIFREGSEYKKYQSRKITIFHGHGGFVPANITMQVRVVEWYKVTLKIRWDNAQAFCEQEGGNLFYRLDGTKEQLDFFYDTFGEYNFWVGVRAAGAVSEDSWINVKGETVSADKLFWGYLFNLDFAVGHFVLLGSRDDARVYMKNQGDGIHFGICDLLY